MIEKLEVSLMRVIAILLCLLFSLDSTIEIRVVYAIFACFFFKYEGC